MMLNLKPALVAQLVAFFMNQEALAFNDPTHHSDFDKIDKNLACQVGSPSHDQSTRIQFVKAWSAFVAKKSFTLPAKNTEDYVVSIKSCFTDQGWEAYTKALKQSGNLELIQGKGFKGSSQVIGMISVSHEEFTYIWEVNVPLTLIYQNQYQKLVQELIVHLRINELSQGHFKVEQIIGFPRQRKVHALLQE